MPNKLVFTHVNMFYANEHGDYHLVWYNDKEIVKDMFFEAHYLTDKMLEGTPVCPACLMHRGEIVIIRQRTIIKKPYCTECGGQIDHTTSFCQCGKIPHDDLCEMWSEGISSN